MEKVITDLSFEEAADEFAEETDNVYQYAKSWEENAEIFRNGQKWAILWAIHKLRHFSPSHGRTVEMSGVNFADWLEQEYISAKNKP